MRHERLVWVAAKPRLEKLNRKWWHSLFALGRTADIDQRGIHGSQIDREELSKGMQSSAFLVDRLAPRFSLEERETLRLTGGLPEWFCRRSRKASKPTPTSNKRCTQPRDTGGAVVFMIRSD